MDKYNDLKTLYGCISTYDDLISKGKILINVIEYFVNEIAGLSNKELKFKAKGDKIRAKEYDFNTSNWNKMKESFNEGKIDEFLLFHYNKNFDTMLENILANSQYDSNSTLDDLPEQYTITLHIISNKKFNGMASLIEFQVHKSCFSRDIPKCVQDKYIELIEIVIKEISCVGGFITVDDISYRYGESPYEEYYGLSYRWNSCNFRKYFRGYFWGSFLSNDHIHILGGMDEVIKNAPVFRVKQYNDNSAFLQLTEDINRFDDNQLKELAVYLKCLLPPRGEYTYGVSAGRKLIKF
jgi:hypothetical protein